MRQRGRRSAADLAVIRGEFGKRPEPPPDLAAAEATIWKAVVSSEPADFFATAATRDMLKAYCRHVATADRLTAVINEFETGWLKRADGVERFDDLTRMRDREARAALMTAVRLRLTNQSRYTAGRAGTAAAHVGPRPWE